MRPQLHVELHSLLELLLAVDGLEDVAEQAALRARREPPLSRDERGNPKLR